MYFGTESYNLEGYIKNHGDGSNRYRAETFGQPRTLVAGDVLTRGLVLTEDPQEGYNGSVVLGFRNGSTRHVPARIPLLLENGTVGKLPAELQPGDILQTGDVVLALPKQVGFDEYRHQESVSIILTGGLDGHEVQVPADLTVALHKEVYPPEQSTVFGKFVVEKVKSMGEAAQSKFALEVGGLATQRAVLNSEFYWLGGSRQRDSFPQD